MLVGCNSRIIADRAHTSSVRSPGTGCFPSRVSVALPAICDMPGIQFGAPLSALCARDHGRRVPRRDGRQQDDRADRPDHYVASKLALGGFAGMGSVITDAIARDPPPRSTRRSGQSPVSRRPRAEFRPRPRKPPRPDGNPQHRHLVSRCDKFCEGSERSPLSLALLTTPMIRGCPSTTGVACSSNDENSVKATRLASALLENCQ